MKATIEIEFDFKSWQCKFSMKRAKELIQKLFTGDAYDRSRSSAVNQLGPSTPHSYELKVTKVKILGIEK